MLLHYLAGNRQAAAEFALWTASDLSRQTRKGIVMNDVIARYIDCWNETDPIVRRKLVDDLWAADAEYIDPLAEARGRAAIDASIGAVQAQFPGLVFTLMGPVDAHHRQARFRWSLGPRDGEPLAEGSDVAVVDDDNKITSVLGFLDKVPS